MRDPFDVQPDVVNADRQASNELVSPNMMPSGTGYVLGNGDAGSWTPNSDSLIRHQFQRTSGPVNSRGDEFNKHLTDPEIIELYYRSRAQEEEILLLRKQVADAFVKELQLLSEKHILERKLSELRMELDEKQDDAITSTMKELNKKKNCLEENLRLASDLKVVEQELYIFTSSLLSLLAEFNIRPPIINASSIGNGVKRLYHHMQWKISPANAGFDDMNHLVGPQPNNLPTSYGHQPPGSSKSRLLQPVMGSKVNDFHHEYIPYQSGFIRGYDMPLSNNDNPRESFTLYKDVGSTSAPNFFDDSTGGTYARSHMPSTHDNQASSASDGEASLPGIEGFQIVGEAKPGSQLRACGYPTNGTTLCIFQWVRHLQDGTRQYIEGATVPDYVVTADDVDTLLAVDCTPMDDNGRQGELVRQFANNQNKITCDQDMHQQIEGYMFAGKALFNVLLLMDSPEDWQPTALTLKRSSYQIKVSRTEAVVVEEKYSPELHIKVPSGHSAQFVLICSDGANLPFCTDGMSQPYSLENDVRLRDIIVLTLRYFQSKLLPELVGTQLSWERSWSRSRMVALDGKKKGKI